MLSAPRLLALHLPRGFQSETCEIIYKNDLTHNSPDISPETSEILLWVKRLRSAIKSDYRLLAPFCKYPYRLAFAQFWELGAEKNLADYYPHCATYGGISLYREYVEPYFFTSTNTFFDPLAFPGQKNVAHFCPCTAYYHCASYLENENVIGGAGAEISVF